MTLNLQFRTFRGQLAFFFLSLVALLLATGFLIVLQGKPPLCLAADRKRIFVPAPASLLPWENRRLDETYAAGAAARL